ncbi:hypothetical protein [Allosalinactinospora lopnorensis]|uniref:hypothetical protein n=1 Tax=Allosalinactinospora lopnorensis TaxID=1352348 RepID=UPI0012E12C16|nr:hypothetical protein [Allosalinactinospora lopnorensis]
MTGAVNGRKTMRAWPRLLLLLCVISGVAVMHTLGHPQVELEIAPHSSAVYTSPENAVGTVPGLDLLPPLDPTVTYLAIVELLLLAGVAAGAFQVCSAALVRPPSPRSAPVADAARPPVPPSLSRLQVLRI